MSSGALSPVAAREAVHLLILQDLARLRGGRCVTVKGGVGLRLFFGSVRYSQDMDLDGARDASPAIRDTLKGIFEDARFTRRLQQLGLRELDPGQGPNKDTQTTFRYKFGVVARGGVRYPTKVEVSFRPPHPNDRTTVESPDLTLLAQYNLGPMKVAHYVREAAVRQKIEALATRREPQARDVFDLHLLLADGSGKDLLGFLAREVRRDRLKAAHGRVLDITYKEYEGQVFEFLGEEARSRFGTESAWDDMRLGAAALIEAVTMRQERE